MSKQLESQTEELKEEFTPKLSIAGESEEFARVTKQVVELAEKLEVYLGTASFKQEPQLEPISFSYGLYGEGKPEESRLDKFMRWLFRVPDVKQE